MRVCFHCGKVIRGQMKYVVPPLFAVQLGDFERAYHPTCYNDSENEAAAALGELWWKMAERLAHDDGLSTENIVKAVRKTHPTAPPVEIELVVWKTREQFIPY